MCRIVTEEELNELCKDPNFCVVCMTSKIGVGVDKEHVCADCQKSFGRSDHLLAAKTGGIE